MAALTDQILRAATVDPLGQDRHAGSDLRRAPLWISGWINIKAKIGAHPQRKFRDFINIVKVLPILDQ